MRTFLIPIGGPTEIYKGNELTLGIEEVPAVDVGSMEFIQEVDGHLGQSVYLGKQYKMRDGSAFVVVYPDMPEVQKSEVSQ